MTDTRGLIRKFHVTRTDGTDVEGDKHHGCAYFVLDVTHDPHAIDALLAYADSCESERLDLAADLRSTLVVPYCGCREAVCEHTSVVTPEDRFARMLSNAENG